MCFNNVALIPIRTKIDNYYFKVLQIVHTTQIFGIIFRMINIIKAHSHQE